MSFIEKYLELSKQVIDELDRSAIDAMINLLCDVRARGGRLFLLGVGGSAANAAHAVNDFRKLVGIESYAPTDNVSELTARINDDGWKGCLASWLKVSRLCDRDAVFIFSVGGGSAEKKVSVNLIEAMKLAKECQASILGIVSRDGGYTATVADACVIVPVVDASLVTPIAEAFQGVVWHLLVSDPRLQINSTKW